MLNLAYGGATACPQPAAYSANSSIPGKSLGGQVSELLERTEELKGRRLVVVVMIGANDYISVSFKMD